MVYFGIALIAVWLIILICEGLWRRKVLKGEYLRKLVHGLVASFVAVWPYFMGWNYIKIAAALMLVGVILNRWLKPLHILGNVKRTTHGDIFFALAIIVAANMTTTKSFFTIAMLHLAWADSIAAIVGIKYGMKLRYSIFGHTKTVLGTLAFWGTSFAILTVGLLLVHDSISFEHYMLAIIALPPLLAAIENFSIYGADNLVVPVVVVAALHFLANF